MFSIITCRRRLRTARQSAKSPAEKLETIDNQIDMTTGTYSSNPIFANATTLFPHQFVNVHLLVDTKRNLTIIPAAHSARAAGYLPLCVAKMLLPRNAIVKIIRHLCDRRPAIGLA